MEGTLGQPGKGGVCVCVCVTHPPTPLPDREEAFLY